MDAHSPEYFAAVAGMADTCGTCTYAIGDRVTYRMAHWGMGYENGRVIAHGEGHELQVEAEDDKARRVIDARPWPTGNVLPF